jgi:hypothetical protein
MGVNLNGDDSAGPRQKEFGERATPGTDFNHQRLGAGTGGVGQTLE